MKIIVYFWDDYFKVNNRFDRAERSLVYELIDVRNNCAHNETHKFSFEYTWRALHSMEHLLNAINEANEAGKIKQQREALTKQNYEILSESVKKSVEAEINWQQVSRTMLETQKFNQLTSNSLTAIDGVALERDEIYVPLGLVERKQRKQCSQDEGSPEKGSELYQEKLIPIENKKFFEQIRYKFVLILTNLLIAITLLLKFTTRCSITTVWKEQMASQKPCHLSSLIGITLSVIAIS